MAKLKYGENDLKFKKIYNKMENIWKKLHHLHLREARVDLGHYSSVATKEQVVGTFKEGLLQAQKIITSLNMAPLAIAKEEEEVVLVSLESSRRRFATFGKCINSQTCNQQRWRRRDTLC